MNTSENKINRGIIKLLKPVVELFPGLAAAYRSYRDNQYTLSEPVETPNGFQLVGNVAMQAGTFEPDETYIVNKLFDEVEFFINVGANIGYYCCHALKKGKLTIAFEPHNTNLRFLLKNIKANSWDNKIEIYPLALSNQIGIIEIYGSGTGASLIKGWANIPNSYVSFVPCSTLDKIIGTRFTGRKVLVLMDIEGAEKLALEGGLNLLEQTPKPIWVVEICISEHQPNGVKINPNLLSTFSMFWERGYTAWTATKNPRLVYHSEVQKITDGGPDTLLTHNFLFLENGRKISCISNEG